MELKFRVRNFPKIRRYLKEYSAKLVDRRIDHYVYLKSGNKLTKTKGKYFLVTIKRKNNLFDLKYRKISKKIYNVILNRKEILKLAKSLKLKNPITKPFSEL